METWLSDPSKVGAYALLLGMVVAFFMGKLVPGPTHDRVVKERDKYLEMLTHSNELLGRASASGVEIARVATTTMTTVDIARVASEAATLAVAKYKEHGDAR